jgi:putative transcriptional regulator
MKDILKNSVAEYRQKSGTTQESLANAVGVTRQTIIAIEKGNYAPSVLLALRIADFFDKPLEKIFYVER